MCDRCSNWSPQGYRCCKQNARWMQALCNCTCTVNVSALCECAFENASVLCEMRAIRELRDALCEMRVRGAKCKQVHCAASKCAVRQASALYGKRVRCVASECTVRQASALRRKRVCCAKNECVVRNASAGAETRSFCLVTGCDRICLSRCEDVESGCDQFAWSW